MYVIAIYDVGEKRCPKCMKCCRKYLNHIQNSVFEGEITKAQLFQLKKEIKCILKEEEGDSFILFISRNKKWLDKEILGAEKRSTSNFI